MKVTAIAPYFGAKRQLATAIVEEIGPHVCYWGLCFGSLAVELAKPRVANETVVDLHGDITNLARVIQHDELGPKLYRALRRVLASEDLFADAKAAIEAEAAPEVQPDLARAFDYFVAAWLGRNGAAGTRTHNNHLCIRYTANGGSPARRFEQAVASIPAWRRRLRGLMILRRDVFEVLPRIDDAPGTAVYVDPPYLKKGSKYEHDFETADHDRLEAALSRFERARVVVSYYEDPRLDELYPGWHRRRIAVSKALSNTSERRSTATELLIMNGPSLVAPEGLFAS